MQRCRVNWAIVCAKKKRSQDSQDGFFVYWSEENPFELVSPERKGTSDRMDFQTLDESFSGLSCVVIMWNSNGFIINSIYLATAFLEFISSSFFISIFP
jgi:hypothetical protein